MNQMDIKDTHHFWRHRQAIHVLGLAILGAIIWLMPAQSLAVNNEQIQLPSDSGQVYIDPDNRFSLWVPSGAELITKQNGIDLAVRSRQGWSISIQSSPANPELKLTEMAARFESKYVGPSKPWSEKLAGKAIPPNTYGGLYEGSGARVQVFMERTPLWDYVLMYIAPSGKFERAIGVFHQVLASFQPVGGPAATSQTLTSIPVPVVPKTDKFSRFQDSSQGYAISYPADWVINGPDDYTTVFSGRAGSEAAYVAVSIRNVSASGAPSLPDSVKKLLQEIRTRMAYSDIDIHHERPVPVSVGRKGDEVHGMQMVSTFRRGDIRYRQWNIVIPRPSGGVLHVWTYAASLDLFQRFQKVAETMAGSMELIEVSAQ